MFCIRYTLCPKDGDGFRQKTCLDGDCALCNERTERLFTSQVCLFCWFRSLACYLTKHTHAQVEENADDVIMTFQTYQKRKPHGHNGSAQDQPFVSV